MISLFHHFLATYGLGDPKVSLHIWDETRTTLSFRYEMQANLKIKYSSVITHLPLHCFFLLQYLAWRVMVRLNYTINLSFMLVGHTKYTRDWCFGLLK